MDRGRPGQTHTKEHRLSDVREEKIKTLIIIP
jgi:hypothetical protein